MSIVCSNILLHNLYSFVNTTFAQLPIYSSNGNPGARSYVKFITYSAPKICIYGGEDLNGDSLTDMWCTNFSPLPTPTPKQKKSETEIIVLVVVIAGVIVHLF